MAQPNDGDWSAAKTDLAVNIAQGDTEEAKKLGGGRIVGPLNGVAALSRTRVALRDDTGGEELTT